MLYCELQVTWNQNDVPSRNDEVIEENNEERLGW
jgi:hypothetical protein